MQWSIDAFFQPYPSLNQNEKLRVIKTYIENLKNERKKRG